MTNKENLLRVITRTKPEWVPCWKDSCAFIPCSVIEDRAKGGSGKDWFGVDWIDMIPSPGSIFMDDINDWEEKVIFPDLDKIDWAAAAEKDLAGIDRNEKLVWMPMFSGMFERVHAFMGIEESLIALLTDTDVFKDLVNAICDFRIKEMDKLITYYKPDVICLHDDYGMKKNMFMKPELWRDIFKEPLRRINEFCKSRDTIFALHCCGKIDPIIEDFVDLGITCWDSVNYCNDLPAIYEKFGDKISFTTSLNMMLLAENNEEEVRAHVRESIDMLGKYGNMAPRDDAPTIDKETLGWVTDEARKYGKDYYKLHPIPEC